MRDEFGGGVAEGLIFAVIVVILMFAVASGGLFNGGGGTTVIHNPQVSQQVPASGNLTPQPDYHQND